MGKSYSDYTFADLRRLELAFLVKDKADDVIEAQSSAFNYIMGQAAEFGFDASNIKAMEHFDSGTGKDLFTDRGLINKRLFKLLGEVTAGPVSIDEGTRLALAKDTILKLTERDYARDINYIDDRLRSSRTYLIEYQGRVKNSLQEIQENERKKLDLLMMIKNGTADEAVLAEFTRIEAKGNFKFLRVENDWVELGINKPVITKYKNREHDIDIALNMGYLGIRINVKTGDFEGLRGPYTLLVSNEASNRDRYVHPHLSRINSICWGNMSDRANTLVIERKYYELSEMYFALMQDYCDENPYISLGSMYENMQKESYKLDGYRDLSPSSDMLELWSVCDLASAPTDGAPDLSFITWDIETELKIGDVVKIKYRPDGSNGVDKIGIVMSIYNGTFRVKYHRGWRTTGTSGNRRPYSVFSRDTNTTTVRRMSLEPVTDVTQAIIEQKDDWSESSLEKIRTNKWPIGTKVYLRSYGQMYPTEHTLTSNRDCIAYTVNDRNGWTASNRFDCRTLFLSPSNFESELLWRVYMTEQGMKVGDNITENTQYECGSCESTFSTSDEAGDCCDYDVNEIEGQSYYPIEAVTTEGESNEIDVPF